MDISIIIVNYNTLKMTKECIDSIFRHTKDVTFEVILIDNFSKDGSKEYFESDSRIRYLYSYENMGFGRANNVGMMLAKGNYILLLNSDTRLLNNSCKIFFDNAKNDCLNFYGSWLLDINQNIITSFGDEPSMFSMLKTACLPYLYLIGLKKRPKSAHKNFPKYGKNAEVGYVSGANMFFSRKIFEIYGVFDYHFFMYFEEAEWQKRLKKYGIKSYIIEGPSIIHYNGGSDTFKTAQNRYYSINSKLMMHRSRKYFLSKYYNKIQILIFLILFCILDITYVIFNSHYRFTDKVRYLFK